MKPYNFINLRRHPMIEDFELLRTTEYNSYQLYFIAIYENIIGIIASIVIFSIFYFFVF